MKRYADMSTEELAEELKGLKQEYHRIQGMDLHLDMSRGNIHYEGYEILDLENYDPTAFTRFNFTKSDTHHIKLVCENEIVVFYIDGVKSLSCRIAHSTQGAHIGVFAENASADFQKISMKIPG